MATKLTDEGYCARCYHAGMKSDSRLAVQRWFMESSQTTGIKIVTATIAFGMGIDKADIRFVYHATIAKSTESFVKSLNSFMFSRIDYSIICSLKK
jgi:ATP-dependent DNA helicase RecQ